MSKFSVTPGYKLVKISNSPNTWLEVKEDLTEEQQNERIRRYKQLTGLK